MPQDIITFLSAIVALGISGWSIVLAVRKSSSGLQGYDATIEEMRQKWVQSVSDDLEEEREQRRKLEQDIGALTSRARETHDEQLAKIAQLERDLENQAHHHKLQIDDLNKKIRDITEKYTRQIEHWQQRALDAEEKVKIIEAKSQERKI